MASTRAYGHVELGYFKAIPNMNAKDLAIDDLMSPEPSDTSARVGQPLVELRDVTVRFGRQTILNKINITIPRGQTLAVIGESGCG